MRSEFIHWALWRTLMRTELFLFAHHTISILAKTSTWCFEQSGEVSCSLLVNTSHTDEPWEARNTYLLIYAGNLFIEHSGEHWSEQNIFRSFTTRQALCQSSGPGALSTLVKSVVLNLLTRATLMSPGKDETGVCGYMLWIDWLTTLEDTDENRKIFVWSTHQKHFSKTQNLVLWAFWWQQLLSTR